MNKIQVGLFNVESGTLLLSDPSYELDTWCQKIIPNVKNGIWNAYIKIVDCDDWGSRNALLYAIHGDYDLTDLSKFVYKSYDGLGVDSGQFGIFDYNHYGDDSQFENIYIPEFCSSYDCDQKFYGACCDITLSKIGAGTIPYGCVSSSGYGDGIYYAKVYNNDNNEAVAVKVFFMDEEES